MLPNRSPDTSPTTLTPPAGLTGQETNAVRTAGIRFAKELIWRMVRFRPTKKPIFIFSSRRSGSTLLMQMIGANRGVMFSDQPFGLYSIGEANINRLPVFAYSQVCCPDEDEEAILRYYLTRLLSGEIRVNNPWKFWSREFHFSNDRLCLKITDAKASIDWIDQQCDAHIIVLTRHPLAQAVSVANNGWLTTGKGLLKNQGFVQQFLSAEQESMCWDVYRSGSELESRVVDWALENLVPLSLLPERPSWLFVGYEDLVQNSQSVIAQLAAQIGLTDTEAMTRQFNRPSRSTRFANSAIRKQMIRERNQQLLIDSWKNKIDPSELAKCFRILDRFGIDLYRPDSSIPNHQCLGRRGLT